VVAGIAVILGGLEHASARNEEPDMEKFKAFRLTEVEKRIRAEFVDLTLDDLDPGDVVVRVAYSSVNYKDALAVTGKGKILRRPSCIGGIDFS
jgi:acrylyl-CoA reductase (NADPH)